MQPLPRGGFFSFLTTMGKELRQLWDGLPCKAEFGALLIAWVLLFHFLGNSTIGYVDTPSMFTWLNTVHTSAERVPGLSGRSANGPAE